MDMFMLPAGEHKRDTVRVRSLAPHDYAIQFFHWLGPTRLARVSAGRYTVPRVTTLVPAL